LSSTQAKQVSLSDVGEPVQTNHTWHFEAEAGITPDADWVEDALLGTIELPGCTAALVSADGLAVTSAACLRALETWIRPGDTLFVADELSREHRLAGLAIRRLISIRKIENNQDRALDLEADIQILMDKDESDRIYREYAWRTYDDVRLVFIPPVEMEDFGNEDGIYPRHAMDFALFRVYDQNDQPLDTESYFAWSDRSPHHREEVFSTVLHENQSFTRVTRSDTFNYNGTVAPPFTTLYGVLDLYHSHQPMSNWTLSEEWKAWITKSNMSAALNFSVAGECAHMGAAIIDVDMEIVGVAFDNTHTPGSTRCVAVSTSGILSLLRTMPNAESIAEELAEQSREEK